MNHLVSFDKKSELLPYFGSQHPRFLEQLDIYADAVEQFRTQHNIIGKNEKVIDHILDSLIPYPFISSYIKSYSMEKKKISKDDRIYCADLGSGAGLPGIPLLLALEADGYTVDMHLLEKSIKKARTLNEINYSFVRKYPSMRSRLLIENRRVEEWKPVHQIPFVVTRAFRPLSKQFIEQLIQTLPDSIVFWYKGRARVLFEEFSKFKDEVHIERIHYYHHPSKYERHIVMSRWTERPVTKYPFFLLLDK